MSNTAKVSSIFDIEVSAKFFIILLPLLTIRGWTNNNIITGCYLLLVFLYLVFNKIYFEDYRFEFYDFKTWFFILLWGLYIVSKSPETNIGVKYYLITMVIPFFIFQIVNNIGFSEKYFNNLFNVMFIVGFFLGTASVLYVILEGYDPKARLTSFWEGYNMVSAYMMIIFMFNLSFIINSKKGDNLLFYLVTIVVTLLGMFLTQTRGVWMATAIAIIIYVIKKPKIIIPVFIFMGIFVYVFYGVIQNRFFTVVNFTKDASAVGRLQAWFSSVILIKQNLFFGYGFDSYLSLRDNVLSFYIIKVVHSHNTFLRSLLEIGLIGTIAYLSFFFKAIYFSFTNKNDFVKEKYKKYIDGFQLTFIGLLIIFNFEPYLSTYDNSCLVIWLIISLAFTFDRYVKKHYPKISSG